MNLDYKKSLIRDINNAYSTAIPNGFLLGWDENRFFTELKFLFSDLKVINTTDFNYSFCNTYEIDLGEKGNTSFILTLKISFIANAFVLYVTEYSKNLKYGKVLFQEESDEQLEYLNRVQNFMFEKGFIEPSNEDLDVIIQDVHLELADISTIDKCLFDDFE